MSQFPLSHDNDITGIGCEPITEPLYEGDTGRLSFEQRQLLVTLLRGPYLTQSEKPHLWKTLLMSRSVIESSLADLFLALIVDEDLGVAFCRQADVGELDAPQLLRQFSLSYLDSVLLLELRQRLLSAEVKGEKAVIALETMEELLKTFDASAKNNERLFKTHVNAVIKRLTARKLLRKLGDNTHLYEICLALKLVFNVEEIVALKKAYLDKADRDRSILELEDDVPTANEDDDKDEI